MYTLTFTLSQIDTYMLVLTINHEIGVDMKMKNVKRGRITIC